jgi:general secretion pathway protein L
MKRWIGRIRPYFSAFLRWWSGELAALVPQRLRLALSRRSHCIEIEVRPASLQVSANEGGRRHEFGIIERNQSSPGAMASHLRETTRNISRRAPETALMIPGSTALRRTVVLPAVAAENLREVLSFEMDRLTPFSAEDVYYDFRVLPKHRDGGHLSDQQMRVDLLVVCRSEVDWALDLVRNAGLQPTWLEVTGQGGGTDLNLLPYTGGSVHRRRYRVAAALVGIACALTAARISLPLYQQEQTLDRLETATASARRQALEADGLKADLDEAIRKARQLDDFKRQKPASIALLAEVTRVLPDDTWLVSLDMRTGILSLSGYSAKALALIALLEDSELLEDVQFRSQVSFDQKSGAERFSISARVTEDATISADLSQED